MIVKGVDTGQTRIGKALGNSALAAAITLVGVSGTMQWLWHTHDKSALGAEFHGYPDYLSATWGDAVCLPLAAATITFLLQRLAPTSGERSRALALALVGAAMGAYPNVRSLLDPAPVLNWTLPQPHHFTPAGWFHAGVAIVGAGLASAGVGTIIVRLAKTKTPPRDVPIAIAVLIGAAGAFVFLVGLDAPKSARDQASVWIPLALAWVSLAALFVTSLRMKGIRRGSERTSR